MEVHVRDASTGACASVSVGEDDTVWQLKCRACDEAFAGWYDPRAVLLHAPDGAPYPFEDMEVSSAGIEAGCELTLCGLETAKATRRPSKPLAVIRTHPTTIINGVAVSPCGGHILAVCRDGALSHYSVDDTASRNLIHRNSPATAVAVCPTARTIFIGDETGSLSAYQMLRNGVVTALLLYDLPSHKGPVDSLCVTQDGVHVFTGGRDGHIRMCASHTGSCLKQWEAHTGAVLSLCMAGNALVSSSHDGRVILWGTAGRKAKRVTTLKARASSIYAVALVPGETRYLYAGGADGVIRMWDVSRRVVHSELLGHTGSVRCLACTPSGAHLLSGGCDATVRVWDTTLLVQLCEFRCHSDWVTGIALSSNRGTFVSCSWDGSVQEHSVPAVSPEPVWRESVEEESDLSGNSLPNFVDPEPDSSALYCCAVS